MMIRETMDLINENTCAKFIPSTRPQHALIINANEKGFRAFIGRADNPLEQTANFDPKFDKTDCGLIAHELFHVLGRLHEHQREDRDDYITVNKENIKPGFEDQIVPKVRGLRPYIKYDHKSVMHYMPSYQDKNGDVKVHFTAKNGEQFSGTYQVQASDFQHINTMYDCDKKYLNRARFYRLK